MRYRSWRESRRTATEQQIDGAARWVVTELREHHEAWTRASGRGRKLTSPEMKRRIPRDVLSDQSLWTRVEERVSADEAVVASTPAAGDISWAFRG